jgi:hypothetical protein
MESGKIVHKFSDRAASYYPENRQWDLKDVTNFLLEEMYGRSTTVTIEPIDGVVEIDLFLADEFIVNVTEDIRLIKFTRGSDKTKILTFVQPETPHGVNALGKYVDGMSISGVAIPEGTIVKIKSAFYEATAPFTKQYASMQNFPGAAPGMFTNWTGGTPINPGLFLMQIPSGKLYKAIQGSSTAIPFTNTAYWQEVTGYVWVEQGVSYNSGSVVLFSPDANVHGAYLSVYEVTQDNTAFDFIYYQNSVNIPPQLSPYNTLSIIGELTVPRVPFYRTSLFISKDGDTYRGIPIRLDEEFVDSPRIFNDRLDGRIAKNRSLSINGDEPKDVRKSNPNIINAGTLRWRKVNSVPTLTWEVVGEDPVDIDYKKNLPTAAITRLENMVNTWTHAVLTVCGVYKNQAYFLANRYTMNSDSQVIYLILDLKTHELGCIYEWRIYTPEGIIRDFNADLTSGVSPSPGTIPYYISGYNVSGRYLMHAFSKYTSIIDLENAKGYHFKIDASTGNAKLQVRIEGNYHNIQGPRINVNPGTLTAGSSFLAENGKYAVFSVTDHGGSVIILELNDFDLTKMRYRYINLATEDFFDYNGVNTKLTGIMGGLARQQGTSASHNPVPWKDSSGWFRLVGSKLILSDPMYNTVANGRTSTGTRFLGWIIIDLETRQHWSYSYTMVYRNNGVIVNLPGLPSTTHATAKARYYGPNSCDILPDGRVIFSTAGWFNNTAEYDMIHILDLETNQIASFTNTQLAGLGQTASSMVRIGNHMAWNNAFQFHPILDAEPKVEPGLTMNGVVIPTSEYAGYHYYPEYASENGTGKCTYHDNSRGKNYSWIIYFPQQVEMLYENSPDPEYSVEITGLDIRVNQAVIPYPIEDDDVMKVKYNMN